MTKTKYVVLVKLPAGWAVAFVGTDAVLAEQIATRERRSGREVIIAASRPGSASS